MNESEAIFAWDNTMTDDQKMFVNLTTQLDGRSSVRVLLEDGMPALDCLKDEAPGLTWREKRRKKT